MRFRRQKLILLAIAVLLSPISGTCAQEFAGPAENEFAAIAGLGESRINSATDQTILIEDASGVLATNPAEPEVDRLEGVRVGYDSGFVICSDRQNELRCGDSPFSMRINGWGQLRHDRV